MYKKSSEYLPEWALVSMERDVNSGVPMGHFLTSLFANDLMKTFARADDENAKILLHYVRYVWNDLPSDCHGSYEIVNDYMKRKREGEKDG